MNTSLRRVARQYATTLRKYLANRQEAVLAQAYELGRMAMVEGLGVLDMARMHQNALEACLPAAGSLRDQKAALQAAETFFLESLSSFEATHRGFRQANTQLQQLIITLEKRNAELAKINQKFAREIADRKRTEKALRESEAHFRKLFNEARRMEENLRHLSSQILHAQEEERKRISRELHDEVGQALTAVSVTLAAMNHGGGGSHSSQFQGKLAEAQKLIYDTMETIHRFARDLRPTMLDELGLLPALRSLLNSFAERTGLRVRFKGDARAEALDGQQKIVLFRIAQESLTNITRHAQASRVEVAVRKNARGICMAVGDNGRSFRLEKNGSGPRGKRLGLLGMEERVRLVNGKFTVKAELGKGTTIQVLVPFPGETRVRSGARAPEN